MREMLKRGGVVASLGILATLALAVVSIEAPAANAQSQYMIGIDLTPGYSPSDASEVTTCVRADVGDEVTADVFVTNVSGLTAWEFRVDYDEDILTLTSADYEQLLVSSPSSGGILAPLFDQEKPGRYFLAAAEPRGPDSGSGVLARLHFEANKAGKSSVAIASSPPAFGPQLTGATGGSIGDANGDNIWDGSVTGGTVAVGQPCVASTPVVTPAPAPGGNSTPRPTATSRASTTPTPGNGSSNDSSEDDNGEGSSSSSGSVFDIEGEVGSGNPSSDEGDTSDEPASDQDPGEDQLGGHPEDVGDAQGDSPGDSITSSDASGGNTSIVLMVGLVAAAAIALGGLLLLVFRRGSV